MPPPLDSDLLRHFLAVAKTGSVTRAAEVVGRTQSAVSMQMKRLEAMVGEPLFERGPRGVALTVRGGELLINARRVVDLIDETAAGDIHRRAKRALRVQFPPETPGEHLKLAALAISHLKGIEVAEGSNHGQLTLFVGEDSDPRHVLATLFASPHLPEPTSFVYGELSLHELYRELYGSEGV